MVRGITPPAPAPTTMGAPVWVSSDDSSDACPAPTYVQHLLPPSYRPSLPQRVQRHSTRTPQVQQPIANFFTASTTTRPALLPRPSLADVVPRSFRQASLPALLPPAPPLPPSVELTSSSDAEWAASPHDRWLHMGAHCANRGRFWFQDSMAEDWFRLAYLAPMCGAPLLHPATPTHSFGPTKVALLGSIPSWASFRELLLSDGVRGVHALTIRLGASYSGRVECLPFLLDIARFWAHVARHVAGHNGPGGRRAGTTASWSESAGFTIYPPAGGWSAAHVVPSQCLWGDLHPLTQPEHDLLVELDYASGRTIVSADCKCNLAGDRHLLSCRRQHYLLLGKIAFVNCLCWEHANLIPHRDPHFNSRRPYYRILDPGDWVGCCTANDGKFVPATDQLGINYGSTYKLSCYRCLGIAPPPKRWRGETGDALLPPIAPLLVRRRASAVAAMVAIASSIEEGRAETAQLISPVGSEPGQDAPVTTDAAAPVLSVVDEVSFTSLPSDWSDPEPDPHVSPPPSPTPASPPRRKRKIGKVVGTSFSGSPLSSLSYEHFGVGAINGASCLSRGQLETFLPRFLRLILATNLSVLAIADTGTRAGHVPCNSDGVATCTHTSPNGESYSFHSVWSHMGLNMAGKPQRKGSGVTILWDSRIPFKDAWVDTQGRACAVTLMGPGRRQVRLLAVYGYASPGSWGDRPSVLLSEVQAQRCKAAKQNLSLIVLGEFNSSPLGDTAQGFPRPPSYTSHKSMCITRACLKEVRARTQTSPPPKALAPKLKDAFRECHPLVNGATRHFKGQKPARHTLIFVPRRYRVIGSNVDSACSWWPDSDHFLLSAWFSFSEVLGVSSLHARSAGRTGFVPSLSTKFLKTPKLRRRWATSLTASPEWKSAAEAVKGVPAGSLEQVEKALHLVEGAVVAACAPFQPPPPPGDTLRPRPSLIAPAWTVLETEASYLRAAIHKSHDPVSAAAPALEAWQSLCSLGRTVEFDVSSLVSNVWDTSSWDEWRAKVSAACGAIQREGVRCRRRASTACVKYFIERRSLDGLAGEDGTPGGLRALIRKIGKSDCPPITPKQVRTAEGGGSTHPGAVSKAARLCHFEWTLSRRQLPPVEDWPPWARAMYRMEGDSDLSDFVAGATELLAVEQSEHSDDEVKNEDEECTSQSSFSDLPTESSSSINSSTPSSEEEFADYSSGYSTPAPSGRPRAPSPPLVAPTEARFTSPSFPVLDITPDFTFEEFVYALKRARNGAPGPSGISYALLRALPHVVQMAFWAILLRCLQLQQLPKSFLLGHIYTLAKPGEPSLHNVRPITLMECSLKILTGILNKRLMDGLLANGVFCSLQFGFIPGRSGTDPIYILKHAMEDAKERNINIYLMLVDLEKAFDSVEAWSLLLSYKWAGLSEASAAMLSALDGKGTARVITPFGLTRPHHVERGVRQGEKLSPTKFILWLEPWLRHAYELYGYHGHTLRGGARLSHQAMCDDLAFLTTSRRGMQNIATSFWRFAFFHGVTGSAKKTVYASTDPAAGVVSMMSFSRLSTPGNPKRHSAILSPVVSGKAIRYLGDQLCMLFRWKSAAGAMAPFCRWISASLRSAGLSWPTRCSTTQLSPWARGATFSHYVASRLPGYRNGTAN